MFQPTPANKPTHSTASRYARQLLAGTLAVWLWTNAVIAPAQTAANQDPLTQYLGRLQLNQLLAVHLQQRFDEVTDPAQRELIGKDLVALYESEIQSGRLDDDQLAATLQRLEAVLLTAPQLRTAEIDILTLQAQYQQAFLDLARWMENLTDTGARDSAVNAMSQLAPRFTQRRNELQERIDELQSRIDSENRETVIDKIVQEQSGLRAARLRATYYAAWNQYYLAIAQQDETLRQAAIGESKSLFEVFLNFDPESDYEVGNAEVFELEVSLRARAGLRYAILEALSQRQEQADKWAQWLSDPRVDAAVREDLWSEYVLAMLLAGQTDEAINRSQQRIGELRPPAQLADVRLCRNLARHGEFSVKQKPNEQGELLRSLGYEGLVRLRQFQIAVDALTEFASEPPEPNNFFLGWLIGYQAFLTAEASEQPDAYRQAATQLATAAKLPRYDEILLLQGYFQMQLGWSWYQAGDFEQAATHFEQVVPLLKTSDEQVAVDAQWMLGLAYQQLSRTQPSAQSAAVAAFQQLILDFPANSKAADARYQIARLQRQGGSAADPIAALEQIETKDDNYELARYEICLVRFERWKAADKDDRAQIYAALLKDTNYFLRIATGEDMAQRRIRSQLMAAEAALGQNDLAEARRRLADSDRAIQRRPDDEIVSQWHYWQLILAQRSAEPQRVKQEAQWLATRGEQGVYRQAGLVFLTQELEQQYNQADEDDKPVISRELIPLYTELVNLLGDSAQALATQKNARVALYKLGWHALQVGQDEEAFRRFATMLKAFPDDVNYLRFAGLASYRSGQYQESVQYWSRLTRGLPSGSEGWFEARFYELDSLRRFDKTQAQAVFQQFQLLHPNVSSPTWKDRYNQLEQELGN